MDSLEPEPPTLKVKQLWTGPGAICGQDANDQILCWGMSEVGLPPYPGGLGLPSGLQLDEFDPNPNSNSKHVAINERQICAINGMQVRCWGAQSDDARQRQEFGTGNSQPGDYLFNTAGAQLPFNSKPIALATRQVDLYAWGERNHLNEGDPHPNQPVLTCAVLENGQLWCWGEASDGMVDGTLMLTTPRQVLAGRIEHAKDVQIGEGKICVLHDDGTVSCWGPDGFTNREINPGRPGGPGDHQPQTINLGPGANQGDPRVIAVAGSDFVVGSTEDNEQGTIAIWKWTPGNDTATIVEVPNALPQEHSGIAVAQAGAYCISTSEGPYCYGTLFAQGDRVIIDYGANGQLIDIGENSRDVPQIACGQRHCCAFGENSGLAYCWGGNAWGQAGRNSQGQGNQILFTNEDGVQVGTSNSIVSMALGNEHTCALAVNQAQEDQVYCWGKNDHGELGGVYPRSDSPLLTSTGLDRWITSGSNHNCGVGEGSLVCWGRNDVGQAGQAGIANVSRPTMTRYVGDADPQPRFYRIAANTYATCFISNAGNRAIRCFGQNQARLIDPNQATDFQVQAELHEVPNISDAQILTMSDQIACSVDSQHQVRCWGDGIANEGGPGGDITIDTYPEPVR